MRKGAIVIHGLTATPAVMAPLSTALSKAGFMVVTPLLSGHGTNLKDLSKSTYFEWYNSVTDAYDELKNKVDEIYCVGLSLGALLAIKLALDHLKPIKKIACLGLPLKLMPVVEKFIIPASFFIKYSKKNWCASVSDEFGRELYKNAGYDKIPISSVLEIRKFQKALIKELPKLLAPTLLIHARRDKVAPALNVELFQKTALSAKTSVLWLEKSEHVVTLDIEKDVVTDAVIKFFSS